MMVTTSPERRRLETIGLWLLLAAGAVVMIFPIYWMFVTAIRPRDEIFSGSVNLMPTGWVWKNFADALHHMPFLTWAGNSLVIAVVAVVITVSLNLLCGYAFAKFRFAGRDILFIGIISALMIPIQVIIVPLFLVVSDLGLLNSYWGVILPRAAEAFGIFMVRQFMVSIPDELLEAARLDGASELTIFLKVVLPLSKPIIAVLIIFTFMWRWNDFVLPLVILTDQDMYTVQVGMNLLKGQYNTEWTDLMAVALLSLTPMLVIFVFFQRQLIQGIAGTGLK
ncbi:carbohydrate ABC transporter permease [Microvirga puerhi]|uniref:sn-glycerol-3-phosphate transport system permease protein UgpE n=1 Tax=Microvirga puerhi TaxID=2876078 RepID=A0ABS7VUQ8_9HYPH|nr:carbohydrate ABC transporter permease [Microvirga puerhi]MBZ6079307.1 carbohydrate ABC transporter permease [Microvirga puerhi]